MLSKSLIQFSVEGRGCVPSLLFDLSPNYGGGDEDNGDLLPKVPCTHHYTECSQPHSSTADPRLHRRLLGKSESVSCGVTAPFPWTLVHTGSSSCPPRVVPPVLCKFWQLYGGLMVTSSKRAYAKPRSAAPRAPAPAAGHC